MRRIGIAILIVILIGGGVWYLYTHRATPATPPEQSGSKNFFPTPESATSSGSGSIGGQVPLISVPKNTPFKQISARAVAGFDVTAPHVIRYVSRANGYVYEVKDGSTPVQVSNIYIPNIYEAFFMDNLNTAILRYVRDDGQTIATYAVPVPKPNTDGTRTQAQGVNLPDNITAFALSPDKTLTARIIDTPDGAIAFTSTSTNGNRTQLVRSAFHEWLVSWTGKNTLYFQTKASALANGFLYRVETGERKFHRVLGDIAGLTTSVSPSGTYVLYTESGGSGFSTKLLNTKTGGVVGLKLEILPEKCVWLANDDLLCAGSTTIPEAQYPDAWYKGLVTFTDQLYRITPSSTTFTTLWSGSISFDMTHLAVDESTRALYFIDKPSGILWQFTY